MKKVKFDNSLSLQQAFAGRQMPPILILEGWLVDDHVCVQKPNLENGSDWRVSLYPWGHVLSFDFYTKSDATEFAKDVCELRIDWKFIHSSTPIGRSPEYKRALAQIRALRNQYEADRHVEFSIRAAFGNRVTRKSLCTVAGVDRRGLAQRLRTTRRTPRRLRARTDRSVPLRFYIP